MIISDELNELTIELCKALKVLPPDGCAPHCLTCAFAHVTRVIGEKGPCSNNLFRRWHDCIEREISGDTKKKFIEISIGGDE